MDKWLRLEVADLKEWNWSENKNRKHERYPKLSSSKSLNTM